MKPYASISRSQDIRRLIAQGRKSRRAGLTVYRAPGPGGATRVALATRASSAVTRNRIKRRLRGALRVAAPEPGLDLLIRADERVAGVDFQELVVSLREACGGAA
jgi:ribonuclease P protein component